MLNRTAVRHVCDMTANLATGEERREKRSQSTVDRLVPEARLRHDPLPAERGEGAGIPPWPGGADRV